ncbi:MAG: hypothetical protein Q9165_003806 [Trypethelium subeluteriae]
MSAPSISLQTLSEIGFLEITKHDDGPSNPSLSDTTPFADPSRQAGSLGPGLSLDRPLHAAAPKKQPPLFWKAMGFCLKTKFTISGSLYDDGRALFLGEPNQDGIAAGTMCPEEVTNYQTFVKCDTMQTLNKPTFSTSGGSYFEYLNLYLKYVGQKDFKGNSSEKVSGARQALINSKSIKDQAWEKARAAYIGEQLKASATPDHSLIGHVKKDADYDAAWEAEMKAEQSFTQLLQPAFASISGRLDLIRLADMRMEPQVGNNMKVIAIDENWLSQLPPVEEGVAPKLVFYRPEYTLPDYQTTALYWIKQGVSKSTIRDGPYEIPLANIWDRLWSDLGHPLLDDAQPQEKLTPESKAFINSLSATVTFLQRPYCKDIRRGLWDIKDPRDRFPLQLDAPRVLRQQFCKTTRLILAWGLEIELNLPDSIDINSAASVSLASLNLPLVHTGSDGRKMIFSSGDTGFPILVGALADII